MLTGKALEANMNARSELAIKILEALNTNEGSRVQVPHDQDVHVGPLTFRYGGGYHRDRWYIVQENDPCQLEGHDFQVEAGDPVWSRCVRPECSVRLLTSRVQARS